MQQSFGAMNEGEPDELKRVLTEGNPYMLALTACVSLLHSVFDALAFKNDIGFWKGKKDVHGLSVRTIAFNAVCQVAGGWGGRGRGGVLRGWRCAAQGLDTCPGPC